MASSSRSSLANSPPPKRAKKVQLGELLAEGIANLHAIGVQSISVSIANLVVPTLSFPSHNGRLVAIKRSDNKFDVIAGTVSVEANLMHSIDLLDCSKENAVLYVALKTAKGGAGWTEFHRFELLRMSIVKFKLAEFGAKIIFAELAKVFAVRMTRCEVKIAKADQRLRSDFIKIVHAKLITSSSFDLVNKSFLANDLETLALISDGLQTGDGAAMLTALTAIGSSVAAYLRGIGFSEPEASRVERETAAVPNRTSKIKSLFPGIGAAYKPNVNELIARLLKSHRATVMLACKTVTDSAPLHSDILICGDADDVLVDPLKDSILLVTGTATHSKPIYPLAIFGIVQVPPGQMEEPSALHVSVVSGGVWMNVPDLKTELYTRGITKSVVTQSMLNDLCKNKKVHVNSIDRSSVKGLLEFVEPAAETFHGAVNEKEEIQKVVTAAYCTRVGIVNGDD